MLGLGLAACRDANGVRAGVGVGSSALLMLLRKPLDSAIPHHSAVGVCDDDYIAAVARLVRDGGPRDINVVFECCGWVS